MLKNNSFIGNGDWIPVRKEWVRSVPNDYELGRMIRGLVCENGSGTNIDGSMDNINNSVDRIESKLELIHSDVQSLQWLLNEIQTIIDEK